VEKPPGTNGRSITGDSLQKSSDEVEAPLSKKRDSASKIHKLKFQDSKVVINFDGKMVKVPPNLNEPNKHNYTSIENSEYSTQGRALTRVLQNKPKPKSKSRHRPRIKKATSNSSSSGICKNPRLHISQECISAEKVGWGGLEYELKFAGTQLSEETEVSPVPEHREYERSELFDLDQIH
jgi:hypothetical protein